MPTTLDRFSEDLDRLIAKGTLLKMAMIYNLESESFREQAIQQLGKDNSEKYLKDLPDFKIEYEEWYSESLALLKQLLPDRVNNFVSFYEKRKGRKEITYGEYVIQDYLQGLHVTQYGETKVGPRAALPQFEQQLAILKATKSRFASSLYDLKQLLQADLFDSELDAVRALYKSKFFRAAGVIAGVILEKHLRQVCDQRGIPIAKKHPTLGELNDLLKTQGTIDVPQWRHLAFLADIRNLCAHNKQQGPTPDQVLDLLNGTEKVIKTIM